MNSTEKLLPAAKKKEIVRNKPTKNQSGNNPIEHTGNTGADGEWFNDDVDSDQLNDEISLDEYRRRREHYRVLQAKLNYEKEAGLLLPYQDMIDAVSSEYARLRTRLIAIPPEHGPRLRALASTTDDTDFVAALQELIHEAMEELSRDGDTTNS